MQDRAAREAAERERLRQQNQVARHAARQRALQEKQQQELTQPLTQASHRQRQAVSTAQSSAYLQRLRGRQPCQQLGHARLPEWARAARPLPPLLPGSWGPTKYLVSFAAPFALLVEADAKMTSDVGADEDDEEEKESAALVVVLEQAASTSFIDSARTNASMASSSSMFGGAAAEGGIGPYAALGLKACPLAPTTSVLLGPGFIRAGQLSSSSTKGAAAAEGVAPINMGG